MAGLPIYVINLDEDTGRMDRISRQLREQGLPFTRFGAFRGRDIPDPWKAQFEDTRIGAGEVGCYASHLQVMADMLASEDPIRVILEDDAFLSPHFADLLGALPDALPGDWDIVRFSTQLRYPVVRVAALPHGFGIYSYSRLPFSTVGYMINRRFASSFTRPRERAHPLDAHFQHPSMFGNFTHIRRRARPGPLRARRSVVGRRGRPNQASQVAPAQKPPDSNRNPRHRDARPGAADEVSPALAQAETDIETALRPAGTGNRTARGGEAGNAPGPLPAPLTGTRATAIGSDRLG